MVDDEDNSVIFPEFWKVSGLSTGLSNGMSPDWYMKTQIRQTSWDGKSVVTLTDPKTYMEYGPAVSAQNDRLAFTRLSGREGVPWIVVSDLDGQNDRAIVQGQYPTWGPLPFDFDAMNQKE